MSLARSCGLLFVLACVLVSISCGGEPPDSEMQQAQGALDAARAAGAERYAAEEFLAAVDALTRAHAAAADRDYRLALNNALDSRDRAKNAARMAADGKAAARVDADRALTAAADALADAQATAKAAESLRSSANALGAVRTAIAHAKTRLQEARSAFDKGDYMVAATQAKAVTSDLTVATGDLETASPGSTRRRR